MRRPGHRLWGMGENESRTQLEIVEGAAALPELNPWRAASWLFRDGDCIEIERQADEPDARVLVD
jgi:hypothetical protein